MRTKIWGSLVAGLLVAGGVSCSPQVLTTSYQPYTINIYGPPSPDGKTDPFALTAQFKITLRYFEDNAGQIPYGSSLSQLPSGFEHFSPTVVVTYPGSATSFPLTKDGNQAALPRLNANQQNFFVKAEILGLDASGTPVARARCPLQQISADPEGTMGTVTCQAFYGLLGKWTFTRPMHEARADFAAVALPDGRIVVAGGRPPGHAPDTGNYKPLNSIEVYDPFARDPSDATAPPGIWTTVGSFRDRRFGLTGTYTPDGHIIFAGGMMVQNPPNAQQPCGGMTTEGCVLAPSAEVDVFDVSTLQLEAHPATFASNEFRAEHAAALLNGTQVLIAGGVEGIMATNAPPMLEPAVDFQVLTPTLETSLANSDVERHFPCLTSVAANEMVLCSGVWKNGSPSGEESCEVLDTTGALQQKTMGSVPRTETKCDSVNGSVFLVGGEPAGLPKAQAKIEMWSGGSIQPFADSPYEVVGHGVAASNGQIVVTGGQDPSDSTMVFNKTYWINPATPMQKLSAIDSAALHVARSGLQLLGLPDGTVIALGGAAAGQGADPGAEILAVPDPAQ